MFTLEFYFETDAIPENSSTICFADIMSGLSSVFVTLNTAANGSLAWAFVYPSEQGPQMKVVSLTVVVDVWYKFDVASGVNGATETFQFSINDLPVFTAAEVGISWSPTVFDLGTFVSNGYRGGNIYIDDVTVTNAADITSQSPSATSTAVPEFSLWAVVLTLFIAGSVFISALVTARRPEVRQETGLTH